MKYQNNSTLYYLTCISYVKLPQTVYDVSVDTTVVVLFPLLVDCGGSERSVREFKVGWEGGGDGSGSGMSKRKPF